MLVSIIINECILISGFLLNYTAIQHIPTKFNKFQKKIDCGSSNDNAIQKWYMQSYMKRHKKKIDDTTFNLSFNSSYRRGIQKQNAKTKKVQIQRDWLSFSYDIIKFCEQGKVKTFKYPHIP